MAMELKVKRGYTKHNVQYWRDREERGNMRREFQEERQKQKEPLRNKPAAEEQSNRSEAQATKTREVDERATKYKTQRISSGFYTVGEKNSGFLDQVEVHRIYIGHEFIGLRS